MTDADRKDVDPWPFSWLTEPRRAALSWVVGVGVLVHEAVTGGERLYLVSAAILLMGLPITAAFDKRLRQ